MSVGQVYVIDDDEEVNDALRFFLSTAGYEATSYLSASSFLTRASEMAPGCVLLDVRMPGMSGLELLDALSGLRERFSFIVMTGHGDVSTAVQAMKAGAVDFIEKPFEEQVLLRTLAAAFVAHRHQLAHHGSRERAASAVAALTARERDVLEGIVAGWSNKMIAFRCNISVRTVEMHRANLMQKMQARNVSDLVKIALDAGVVGTAVKDALSNAA